VKLLLDTHALLWWFTDAPELSLRRAKLSPKNASGFW